MEIPIPPTFENYQSRRLSNGTETTSETTYKGYIIKLRAYTFSGISAKIFKLNGEKRILLRQEHWNFYEPLKLLEKMKNYIDNYEANLIKSFNRKTNS